MNRNLLNRFYSVSDKKPPRFKLRSDYQGLLKYTGHFVNQVLVKLPLFTEKGNSA